MKEILPTKDSKRFVFYSENAFTIHIGENYEALILQAEKEMKPAITFRNVNGCNSSIPLERALNLLEKYYKLTRKSLKHSAEIDEQEGKEQKIAKREVAHYEPNKPIENKKDKRRANPALAGTF